MPTVRRDIRRSGIRAAHALRREVQLEHLLFFGLVYEIRRKRDIGQLRIFLQSGLEQQIDVLCAHPVGMRNLDGAP